MSQLTLHGTFTLLTCCHANCGINFAVPAELITEWRNNDYWYSCPHGHQQRFAETETYRLQQHLERKKRELEAVQSQRDAAQRDAKSAQRSAAIVKGKHKALKTRVAAGLCPCCRRPFSNLMRHMQHQHPGYAAAKEEG